MIIGIITEEKIRAAGTSEQTPQFEFQSDRIGEMEKEQDIYPSPVIHRWSKMMTKEFRICHQQK